MSTTAGAAGLATYDVFMSYAHADQVRVRPLVEALRTEGLRVWFDETDIATFEGITRAITQGLARAKGLVAFYSATYPTRRACQWELTAAFLAAQHEGEPVERIWVINAETHPKHIEPVQLRDALFHSLPAQASSERIAAAAQLVAKAAVKLSTPFSAVRPLAQPTWHGGKGLGSDRFVGRNRELWTLHSELFAGEAAVITGKAGPGHAQVRAMGGVGKSLLAEEYALRFGAAYPGGVFLLAGNADRDEQLYAFASRLGVAVKGLDANQIEGALEEALRARAKCYLWLVDDLPAGLPEARRRQWLAPNALGKTLITTRSREYGSTGGLIDLAVLQETDGYALLTARRKPDRQDEELAARALVTELGGHALALDVAGGTLKELLGIESFSGFLAKVRSTDEDALEAAADELRPDLPNGHDRSIARTLSMSVALLTEPGRDFLRLASQVAQDLIPVGLVEAVFDRIGVRAKWGPAAVLKNVMDHCLAEPAKQLNGNAAYSVHALVRRTMRHFDESEVRREVIRDAALRSLLAALPAVADARNHLEMSANVTHARHLARSLDTNEEVRLLAWVARYDFERGAFAAARVHSAAVLKARRRVFDDDHPDTLNARLALAATLVAQGELQAGRLHQEAVLEARVRLLGAEHLDTLITRNNLAQTLYAQGQLQAARLHQEAVLEAMRRLLSEENYLTLNSRHNLAQTLFAQGELQAARLHQEAALKLMYRLHGDEHPLTLIAVLNLSAMLYAQGDFGGARLLQETVLDARLRLIGHEHPDTLVTRQNLAATLYAQGDLVGARGHNEAVFDARRRLLGYEHPDTLVSQLNLAGTLQAQGELGAAHDHNEAVLKAMYRLLGEEHPLTLNARSCLAGTLKARGDLAAARGHNEAVLDARRRLLGEEHPDTLSARNNLAATLDAQGDLAGARGHWEAVLGARRRLLGEEHPDTLGARNNLAGTLQAQGDLAGARGHNEAVLDARRRLFGEEHRDTLTARNNLAGTLQAQGDLAGARDHNEAVLDARRRLFGEEHPDTLGARNNLAATLDAQGDLAGARGHWEAVLGAMRRLLGDEHPATLTVRNNLAGNIKAQMRWVRSEDDLMSSPNANESTNDCAVIAPRFKTRRNQPCPCGSGKKYKRCCDAPERA